MEGGLCLVFCPTCFEGLEVRVLPREECPAVLDYDCEVCCRPMVLSYDEWGVAVARGLWE